MFYTMSQPVEARHIAFENDSYRNHVTVEIHASAKLDYRLYYLLLKHMKILEF